MRGAHNMNDPLDNHTCRRIAEVVTGNDRQIWVGELLEPIVGHESETHCVHITTPAKQVVFAMNHTDAGWLAVLAQLLHGKPINPNWVNRMEARYRRKVTV